METNVTPDTHTIIGTAGGTLLTIFLQVKSADMYKTAMLAFIAAIVSFTVSHALKLLLRWIRKIKT